MIGPVEETNTVALGDLFRRWVPWPSAKAELAPPAMLDHVAESILQVM